MATSKQPEQKRFEGWCRRCERTVSLTLRRRPEMIRSNPSIRIRCKECEGTVIGELAKPEDVGGVS